MWDDTWADAWDAPAPTLDPGWNNTATPPVVTTPQYGSVFGVLDSVSSSIGKIATAAAQLRGTINASKLSDAQARLQLAQGNAGIDIARIQTAGAVDVERLRSQAAVASAQRALADAQGTTILQMPTQGRDWLMLALAAAGVFFAWKAAK